MLREDMQPELCRLDEIICKRYFENVTVISDDRPQITDLWLVSDMATALKLADDLDETKEELMKILSSSSLPNAKALVDKAYEDALIRRDFSKALDGIKHGYELSTGLGYSFSSSDLILLAKLHKKNRRQRRKIEELLEDCNFHVECAQFSRGDYSSLGQ